jgi:predicted ATP-dependent serine protease
MEEDGLKEVSNPSGLFLKNEVLQLPDRQPVLPGGCQTTFG